MLGKLFAFLSPAPKKAPLQFLDSTPAPAEAKTKKANKPEYSAIETLEKKYGDITQQEIDAAQDFMNKKSFRFYTFLLGEESEQKTVNALEKKILIDTNKMLNRPEVMIQHLPQLPQSVTQLKSMLETQDFNLDEFSQIVQREPALASHMVKVANSPMYNHSGKEISNLGHAFMLIGAEGVKEHILMRFFKQLLNIRPIYFKMFGAKIWDHSLSTAMVAKHIAAKNKLNHEAAYLNGLIHDIGKIMIFQLMVNAFRNASPDESPNSLIFKKLLNEKSMQISVMVAKEWQMPEAVVQAIQDLALTIKRPAKTKMGRVLYEANLVSELVMLHQNSPLSPEQYLEIAKSEKLSRAATESLFNSVVAEGN
ncbi:HDOD domain-containing protein [Planctobacterium marinum]|uniref:HDOD domain-containing protein n=1 Tax=Planctobacterium marinum TaxID=1631968 RepID=UPI001E53E1BB|nr:HDOD domain-containing protein [Planctobacterium marinum]MCC2605826.1 HDOD domain-containing protein [Planctobacterium marinum]